MRCVTGLSAVLLFSLVGAAHAQGRGSQAEQDACTPDVFRLCSAYIPSESSIVACLQSNKRSLSQGCHDVFFPRRAAADLDMTPTGSIGAAKTRMQTSHKQMSHRQLSRPHRRVAVLTHKTRHAKR